MLQAPDRFVAAAARNPVCNLALMVSTSDIPDWCYVEAYGSEGKNYFTEAPSAEHLTHLYNKSPILHVSKVGRSKASYLLLHWHIDVLKFSLKLEETRIHKSFGQRF